MSTRGSNIMNGMSRFLSRREKNHEKRDSKGSRSKVYLPFLRSSSPPAPICPTDGSRLPDEFVRKQFRLSSFGSRRKIPSLFPVSCSQEKFYFLRKRPLSVQLTACFVQASTANCLNFRVLQSRLVPTELYNIFSNEGAKKPDKEEEKKVCSF